MNAPSWMRKVDHRLRALWVRTDEATRQTDRIRVLVKFEGSAVALERVGFEMGTASGGVATAMIRLADVPRACDEASVQFIELAQPITLGD